jgi:hypothetical protein
MLLCEIVFLRAITFLVMLIFASGCNVSEALPVFGIKVSFVFRIITFNSSIIPQSGKPTAASLFVSAEFI